MKRYFWFIAPILLFGILIQGNLGAQQDRDLSSDIQDELILDQDGDGLADSGDVIRYTVSITNCGDEAIHNVKMDATLDKNTSLLSGAPNPNIVTTTGNCATSPTEPQQTATTPETILNTATPYIPTQLPTQTQTQLPTETQTQSPTETQTQSPTETPTQLPPTIPSIIATDPIDASIEVALDINLTVTFDEDVVTVGDWFEMVCSISGTYSPLLGNVFVTGGATIYTIDPSLNLAVGDSCIVTVFASQVQAVDDNTPLATDYVFSFITETPPTVLSTYPISGSSDFPNYDDIVITFDEPVNIIGAASFSLQCPMGLAQGFTVYGHGTSTITIDPASPLMSGVTCHVVASAMDIYDTDLNDPPNLLDGNGDGNEGDDYSFWFVVANDPAPSVQTIIPANNASSVALDTTIEITFDEPVDVTNGAFTLECPVGNPIAFSVNPALTALNETVFTLTPNSDLPSATTCTVGVNQINVSDTDLIDPPDTMSANFSSTFTTEAPPSVINTIPANNETDVAINSHIVINFSEPVNVSQSSFTLECPVATPISFNVSGTGTSSITIEPLIMPATTICTITVQATNVTDVDSIDPPDTMVADYVFSFQTVSDSAPTVDQAGILPASTVVNANASTLNDPVSTTPTFTIPFSESVDVLAGAFTLMCAGAEMIDVTPALPATATSFTIAPTSALTPGESCTLTVIAVNVADTDINDPPNLLAENYLLTFTVDSPPAEILTQTQVGGLFADVTGAGALDVDLDTDIQVTFNEAVNVSFPINGLQCPVGNNIPATVINNNATVILIRPDDNLAMNTACVLNIPVANISDVDTIDAPDHPLVAVNHTFTTVNDAAPTVTTNPTDATMDVSTTSNITVIFSEPVTLTGGWFDLSCTVSGNRVSTGELTGTGITIIETTPDMVYVIDPTADFGSEDVCTITISSSNVADNDMIDPPNLLDGNADGDVIDDIDNYVAVFVVEEIPALALDDAFTITPHLTYISPTGVLANDTPNTATITGFGATSGTANGTIPNGSNYITAGGAGGRVVLRADGTFSFYPDAGDGATSTATFFYTLNGGSVGEVELTFNNSELLWFVDNAPASCTVNTGTNSGTQACPASTLASVASVDSANDIIYIAEGDYSCDGIALEAGEWVIGSGASGTLASSVASRVTAVTGSDFSPYNPTGTNPLLSSALVGTSCFSLASDNEIRGLTIGDNDHYAFVDAGASVGALIVDDVSIIGDGSFLGLANGGTITVNLNDLSSGEINVPLFLLNNINGTINQAGTGNVTVASALAHDVISVNGGGVSMNLVSDITVTEATAGRSTISITGGHTGTLTFNGAITSQAPAGDNFQFDNADGTYQFTATVSLTAGTSGINIQNGSAGVLHLMDSSSLISNIAGIAFRVNQSPMDITVNGQIYHADALSVANRAIEIIGNSGAIQFDGQVHIGSSNPQTAIAVYLSDTGSTDVIYFSSLNIRAGNGHLPASSAFYSDVSGRIAIDSGEINCNGDIGADNHCFDVSNTISDGVSIDYFLVDYDDVNESGGAISLNNTSGTFAFLEIPRLTGFNATMVEAVNFGSLTLGTLGSGDVVTSNRPSFDLNGGEIDINFNGISVYDSVTHGIRLQNLIGEGFKTTGNIIIHNPTDEGIVIRDITDGVYHFGSNAVSTVNISGSLSNSILIDTLSATSSVDFGIVTLTPNSARHSVLVEDMAGALLFDVLNINQGNLGTGETIINNIPGLSDEGDAIRIQNSTGNTTINGGTIQNVSDDGIDIRNAGNLVLNDVVILGRGLTSGTTSTGIQLSNIHGINTFSDVTVAEFRESGPAGWLIYLTQSDAVTATLNINNSTLIGEQAVGANSTAGRGFYAVILDGTTDINVDNVDFTDIFTDALTIVIDDTGDGNLFVASSDFYQTGANGNNSLSVLSSTSNSPTITIEDNTFNDNIRDLSRNSIAIYGYDTTNIIGSSITGNTITSTSSYVSNTGKGIEIGLSQSASLAVTIDNNMISNLGNSAIYISAEDNSTLNLYARNNQMGTITQPVGQVSGVSANAFSAIGSDNSTINLLLLNSALPTNNIVGQISSGHVNHGTVLLRNDGAGVLNATVSEISIVNTGGNVNTLNASNNGSGAMCLDVANSSANAGAGMFRVARAAGTMNLRFVGNNPATASTTGIIGVTAGCTQPIVMSAPTYAHTQPDFGAENTVAQAKTGNFVSDLLGAVLDLGVNKVHAQTAPNIHIPFGTIPPRSTVTVTFDVIVGQNIPNDISVLSMQGLISGDGFESFLTNDPDTALGGDPTQTMLDPLRNVTQLPDTGETPWWRNWLLMGLMALMVGGMSLFRRWQYR